MAKRSFSINDETDRLLNYYLNHSDKEWDLVINEAIKSYVCDHLTQKQVHEAVKHTGKDAFQLMKFFVLSIVAGSMASLNIHCIKSYLPAK